VNGKQRQYLIIVAAVAAVTNGGRGRISAGEACVASGPAGESWATCRRSPPWRWDKCAYGCPTRTSSHANRYTSTATYPTITDPTITVPTITDPTITDPTITDPTITDPTITPPTVVYSTAGSTDVGGARTTRTSPTTSP
jgi:hypothetical protein